MLASGSKVLIRESGAKKPVDELMISDLVFNPWSRKYVEIVDILSRTVDLANMGTGDPHPLYPVQLKADSIAKGRPDRPLLMSTYDQSIFERQGLDVARDSVVV